jgi:nuclear pore complex protein Nup85
LRGLSKASVFFLDTLKRHSSEDLQRLSQELIPLIDSQPRLQYFSAERDFVYASRRWKDKVKTLRLELDHVPEGDRHDGFENWWDRISDIVGVLEGREEVIQKICEDIGGDWKEVSVAWGIFADTRIRRRDLP